jgi:hypothetical protein
MLHRLQGLTLKTKLTIIGGLLVGIGVIVVAVVASPAAQHAVRIGQG